MSNPQENDSQSSAPNVETRPNAPPVGVEAAAIVRRKKREDMLKKWSLGLRWSTFVFSFAAFVIMVCNRHGKEINFEDYDEYSYLLAIAIITSVYSAYQGIREVIQLVTGKYIFPQPAFVIIDCVLDQVLAYLLISAASSAIPMTNRGRLAFAEYYTIMTFIDMAAASISMAFIAFLTLAFSLLISGYNLFAHFFLRC